MPKKNEFKFFYVLLFVMFFSSCNKNKYPGCKITSPINEQVFNAGEMINISVDMHDDGDALMSEYLFVIKQNNNLDTVIDSRQHDFLFGKYILNKNFVAEPNTRYKIFALARGGHGNNTVDSIFIKSN